ncbi:MAG: NUDIX hydrolase [Acidimicrobiales bacterium]
MIPRPVRARPGLPPAWAALDPAQRRGITLDRVRAALAARTLDRARDRVPPGGTGRRGDPCRPGDGLGSAVLVALFEEGEEARVVLTRRSAELLTHRGEVAFPGGRLDPGEGPVEAALREATEEVGLPASLVEVVGQLSALHTVSSRSGIVPVVGFLAARPALRPNPAEVDRVFDASLAELASGGIYREERWGVAEGPERPIHFFELDGETVWGATARVLRELLDVVLGYPSRHELT